MYRINCTQVRKKPHVPLPGVYCRESHALLRICHERTHNPPYRAFSPFTANLIFYISSNGASYRGKSPRPTVSSEPRSGAPHASQRMPTGSCQQQKCQCCSLPGRTARTGNGRRTQQLSTTHHLPPHCAHLHLGHNAVSYTHLTLPTILLV